jgi:hypothetical protein
MRRGLSDGALGGALLGGIAALLCLLACDGAYALAGGVALALTAAGAFLGRRPPRGRPEGGEGDPG